MSGWMDWLLGLDRLRMSDAGVEFGMAHRVPGWAWALLVVIALALAVWSYRRLDGPRWGRIGLAAARWTLLVFLAWLAAGPQLIRVNERTEADWVLMLVDRSKSLSIGDGGGVGSRQTRDEQLRQVLDQAGPALATTAATRRVVWLGFDGGLYELQSSGAASSGTSPAAPLGEAVLGPLRGNQTAIGRAIAGALAKAAARPVAGIVLLTDGRSIDEPDRASLSRLKTDQIPVLALPLGSAQPVEDLAVSSVQTPSIAFVNDTVPVQVELQRSLDAATLPPAGTVELIDQATGEVIESRPLPQDPSAWRDGRSAITLVAKPKVAGQTTWTVRVRPDAPDLIDENNRANASVELVDRALRVLLIDGYPRWEYRYLKNLLLREASIESVSMLLAPNRQFIQESSGDIVPVPRTEEEWARYDVIVLGDVTPEVFSLAQLDALKRHVAVKGGGLIWIGGPSATPTSWRDSPLADLLPFTLSIARPIESWSEPVVMRSTALASRMGLLLLSDDAREPWPARLADPATGWSQLHFCQRIDRALLKPTAEVLAMCWPVSEAPTTLSTADGSSSAASASPVESAGSPIVTTMRYGGGRVMYLATDEIWRWRYARGETLTERFWLPLLRLQGRESLARVARPADLEASPRRGTVGQPVRLTLRIGDQSILDAMPEDQRTMSVRIVRRVGAGETAQAPTELKLTRETPATAPGESRGDAIFAATVLLQEPGQYLAVVNDAAMTSQSPSTEFELADADDELRRPAADHAFLEGLTRETGGKMITAADLSSLDTLLPRRDLRVATTPDIQPLWDRPIMLIAILVLLTMEWVGRRLMRLV